MLSVNYKWNPSILFLIFSKNDQVICRKLDDPTNLENGCLSFVAFFFPAKQRTLLLLNLWAFILMLQVKLKTNVCFGSLEVLGFLVCLFSLVQKNATLSFFPTLFVVMWQNKSGLCVEQISYTRKAIFNNRWKMVVVVVASWDHRDRLVCVHLVFF